MSETIDDILSNDYLGDLEALDIVEVRARRSTCKDVETGLSYLRRLVQGRLDVVAAEHDRREAGDDGDGLEDLIARLPALLAGSTRSPGTGRLPESLGTGALDPTLEAELEEIISHGRLSDPSELTDAELDAARVELGQFEAKVSGLRRSLFDRIDALEAELTRRYRTGEASVDSLLG
ncbi:MAG: RsiG family protein [Acidimicrobiales bacterium]